MTNSTISLADATAMIGVEPRKHVPTGRHYFNVRGAAYVLYWQADKIHFALSRGRSDDHATAVARNILGCSMSDRRTSAAAYCVIDG